MCLKNTHQPTRGVFFLMDDEKDIDDFRFFFNYFGKTDPQQVFEEECFRSIDGEEEEEEEGPKSRRRRRRRIFVYTTPPF